MPDYLIDPNAMSIVEYGHFSNDPQIKEIGYSLHEMGSALDDLPLETDPTLRKRGLRWIDNLPTVSFTPLNTPPPVSSGVPTPWSEQVYLVANKFQVDQFYMLDKNAVGGSVLDQRVRAWLEHAFKFSYNNMIINNDQQVADGGDPNWVVGYKARTNNTAQYGLNAEMSQQANVNLQSTLQASDAENALETLELMLDYQNAPTGEGVTIYCNDYWRRRMARAIRTVGAAAGWTTQKDNYDRTFEMYKGAKIRDLGRVAPAAGGVQTTRIVSATEDPGGTDEGTGNCTSAYAVRHGSDHLSGWQMIPLKPYNCGIDPIDHSTWNVVIRWVMGLWCQHTRSIMRTYGWQLGNPLG